MPDARRLFHMISVIERRHGLTSLDTSSRALLDIIVSRELNGERSTARELIEVSGLARALVYRKLNVLKDQNWIQEYWEDYKLYYKTSAVLEDLSGSLKECLT